MKRPLGPYSNQIKIGSALTPNSHCSRLRHHYIHNYLLLSFRLSTSIGTIISYTCIISPEPNLTDTNVVNPAIKYHKLLRVDKNVFTLFKYDSLQHNHMSFIRRSLITRFRIRFSSKHISPQITQFHKSLKQKCFSYWLS